MQRNIIMIDDDLDDQYLYGDIFKSIDPHLNISFKDSAESFFEEYAEDKDLCEFIPDMIILDLNLPKYTGLQIYVFIKENKWLKNVPVIILTTSASPMDIDDCRKQGLYSYFIKPMDYEETKSMIKGIYQYWFQFNASLTVSQGA